MFSTPTTATRYLWLLILAATACGHDKTTAADDQTPGTSTSPPGTSSGGGSGTTTTSTQPGLAATFDAQIRVLDIDRVAVTTATLVSGGTSYTADANGVITVPNVSTSGFLVGTVSATGFMTLPLTMSAAGTAGRALDVTLSKPELAMSFTASSPATVELHGGKIAFSANAFAQGNAGGGAHFMSLLSVDANAAYDGNVNLSAKSLNPATEVFQTYSTGSVFGVRSDFDTASIPAGAARVYLADGTALNAFPEASMQMQVTDGNNNPLQLQDGVPATVRLPLTPFTSHALGDTLPLLTYDNNNNAWTQQGNCLVETSVSAGVALECVGTVTEFGSIGVPAAPVTTGFPCTNFNVTLSADLKASNISAWVEEEFSASSPQKSRNTSWNKDGTLCYVGGAPQVRVKAQATINGNTTVFTSDVITPAVVAEASQDLMEFTAGQSAHACFRCVETNITFGSSQAQTAVDKDGDGYFSYSDNTIGNADCNDNDPTVHPGAAESVCDHADKNCDGITPPGSATVGSAPDSATWNNVYCKLSCAVKTTEVPGNDVDENCDGVISDRDNDTYYSALDPAFAAIRGQGGRADCDDANARINPGSIEVAGNSTDEDCDGFAVDVDADGQLSPLQSSVNLQNVSNLQPVTNQAYRFSDCADWDSTVYFGADVGHRESVLARFYSQDGNTGGWLRNTSLCQYIGADGTLNAAGKKLLVDVNCDGIYTDLDGDGYTVQGDMNMGDANDVDCNDFDPRVNTQSSCSVAASVTAADGGACAPGGAAITATCASGFALNHATGACQDINECAGSVSPCRDNQTCINTVGSYTCTTLVPPLTGGNWMLTATGSNSLQAHFTCATGGTGTVTYSFYMSTGTPLKVATVADLTGHTQLQRAVTQCFDVDLDVSNPNTLYSVGIVATDANGISILYPPQSVTTPVRSLSPGQSSVSSSTSTSVTLLFSEASGGVPPYAYNVFVKTGGFGSDTNMQVFLQNTKPTTSLSAAGSVTVSNLNAAATYGFLITATDARGYGVLYGTLDTNTTSVVGPGGTNKRLFAVSNNANIIGGVAGADALCNAGLPQGVVRAKAVIVDGDTRIACTSPYCGDNGASENRDWALQPNTTYINPNNTVVGTTNAGGVFTFPLAAPAVATGEWFGGIDYGWVPVSNNCQGFTQSAGSQGNVGILGDTTGNSFFYVYSQYCDRYVSILCAEQ